MNRHDDAAAAPQHDWSPITRLSARIARKLHVPVDARIRALAEAYADMTNPPPGRPRLSSDEALWALWRRAGEDYPAEHVEALIEIAGHRRSQRRPPIAVHVARDLSSARMA